MNIRYVFKPEFNLIAKTVYGLEEVLAEELKQIGAEDISINNRAVIFKGDQGLMYKANLLLRSALKILKQIREFTVTDEKSLYKGVKEINWSDYLDLENTLAVDSTINSRYFNHASYVSLKTKDAIVDQFREKCGARPSVNVTSPSIRINVHISGDKCILSLDSSSISLHKRGYGMDRDKAPINEVLAAGLVLLSGWDKKSNFIDPMCGSGTILIEAAMFAYNIAPGINKKDFGFMRWRDFNPSLWNSIRKNALKDTADFKYKIVGSDISERAISIAKENIKCAGLDGKISVSKKPFEESFPPHGGGILIMNPPYGERMKKEDIVSFYKMIGDRLKQYYTGYNAWILSSNRSALKHIGLRPSGKITLYNGPLECRFQKYSLYEGLLQFATV